MGFLWDLLQQSQISRHSQQSGNLEQRVAALEGEIRRTQGVLHELITRLEQHVGQDLNDDGRVG
jgi:hypothetical protein